MKMKKISMRSIGTNWSLLDSPWRPFNVTPLSIVSASTRQRSRVPPCQNLWAFVWLPWLSTPTCPSWKCLTIISSCSRYALISGAYECRPPVMITTAGSESAGLHKYVYTISIFCTRNYPTYILCSLSKPNWVPVHAKVINNEDSLDKQSSTVLTSRTDV